MCNRQSVDFMMVVSGAIIETKLQNALIDIARLKRKKITIIGPNELIPIFAEYWKKPLIPKFKKIKQVT